MKVSGIKNFNQSFGVQLDSFAQNGINKTKSRIIQENGEDSFEYKQFCDDVKTIQEKYPNERLYFDMDNFAKESNVWLVPNNPMANLQFLASFDMDRLFSPSNIHRIAEKLNRL